MKRISIIIALIFFLVALPVMAADTTYGPKVYRDSGGDRQVIASDGSINIEDGGSITGMALKIATKAMTEATDWTLSAAEAICNILIITASGSGDAIIAPTLTSTTTSRIYVVRNATDSTVTIKKSAGTGVDIAPGKTAAVYWSGTDYVRMTADATH